MQRFSPDNHMTGDADCIRHDVIIMGGGLAGLCLSIQLKNRLPDLDILVIERRTHPVPEATPETWGRAISLFWIRWISWTHRRR